MLKESTTQFTSDITTIITDFGKEIEQLKSKSTELDDAIKRITGAAKAYLYLYEDENDLTAVM
jgi:hypothetical protein